MNRRNGVTLVEVLIAIFVMGIGLLAILSLFPLGASQMAQAIRDQRAAECAGNAGALARTIWKQACDEKFSSEDAIKFRESGSPPKYSRSFQPFVNAMDDPNFIDIPGAGNPNPAKYPNVAPWPATVPIPPVLQSPFPVSPTSSPRSYDDMMPLPVSGPGADQTSYPVFVDPFGWFANATAGNRNAQWWLPTKQQTVYRNNAPTTVLGALPRRPVFQKQNPPLGSGEWAVVNTAPPIYRQFGLTDDMTFKVDGVPDTGSGSTIQRQGRYTWSYMFRRVRNDAPNRTKVDVTVVVYSGRSLAVASPETAYIATGTNDTKLVTIAMSENAGAKRPAVRRGSWVLDATVFGGTGTITPQGRFYRVVNVEEGVNGGQPEYYLELQTPLAFLTPPPSGASDPRTRRVIIVMENVIEVFQKGEIDANSPPTTY